MEKMPTALLGLLLLAACNGVTTAPHTVPPLPAGSEATGRVILSIPELPYAVRQVQRTLERRLAILGARASIMYDRRRVILDLAGLPPERLPELARVLADPGHIALREGRGFTMDLDQAELLRLDRAVPGCDCLAVWRLGLPGDKIAWVMAAQPPLTVEKDGRPVGSFDRWAEAMERPQAGSVRLVGVDLLLTAEPADRTALMLALGGGSLPEPVSLAQVTPAGGAR